MLRRAVIAIVFARFLAPSIPTAAAGGLEIDLGEDQLYGLESDATAKLQTALMSALFKRAVDTLVAVDQDAVDPNRFSDTGDSLFVNSTAWLAASGITVGCNPPSNTMFCPDQYVTRGELAVFLKRILDRL